MIEQNISYSGELFDIEVTDRKGDFIAHVRNSDDLTRIFDSTSEGGVIRLDDEIGTMLQRQSSDYKTAPMEQFLGLQPFQVAKVSYVSKGRLGQQEARERIVGPYFSEDPTLPACFDLTWTEFVEEGRPQTINIEERHRLFRNA